MNGDGFKGQPRGLENFGKTLVDIIEEISYFDRLDSLANIWSR